MTDAAPNPSTQVAHPWRATLRTVAAGAVGLLPVVPVVADELGIASVPVVAGALAAIGVVTRVLATPVVEEWLHDHAPWLASRPPQT